MYFLGLAANFRGRDVWRHTFAVGTGKDSQELREHFASRYQAELKHVALYHTGRSALSVALKTLLPKNSKVLVNGFTCHAVLEGVKAAGQVPIFADIREQDLHFGVKELQTVLKNHPDLRAIIIQNSLGLPADIAGLEKLAKKHKLVIIEDLAHSAGIFYADGREAGTVGQATILSFGKGKAIDTVCGGALILRDSSLPALKQPTNLPTFADRLRDRFYPFFGTFARALFRLKLQHFWLGALFKLGWIKRSADAKLDSGTRLTHWQAKLALKQLEALPAGGHSPLRQHFLVENRDLVLAELEKAGYHFNEIWYEVPISPVRYYTKTHFPEDECPVAVALTKKIINLPIFYSEKQLKQAYKIIAKHQKDLAPATNWPQICAAYPEANFLQSPTWAKTNELIGHQTITYSAPGAWAMMIVKNAKRGRYLEVPGGPLLDWRKSAQVRAVFKQIIATAQAHRCVFVRLRPQLLDTPENLQLLGRLAQKAPMHLHAQNTVIIDLSQSEEQLLANMRRQTRYEVRRAAKLGVTVESGNTPELFQELHKLQLDTARRQGFVPPATEELSAERIAFGKNARIYVAKKDQKVIAMGLILIDGQEAEYFEAASTSLNRQFPGAYAILWQAMRDLKKQGIKRFNLWGIAPKGQPGHRYAKVTTFKTGFGGAVVEFVPAHDIVLKKFRYLPNWLIETIRKKRRHLA